MLTVNQEKLAYAISRQMLVNGSIPDQHYVVIASGDTITCPQIFAVIKEGSEYQRYIGRWDDGRYHKNDLRFGRDAFGHPEIQALDWGETRGLSIEPVFVPGCISRRELDGSEDLQKVTEIVRNAIERMECQGWKILSSIPRYPRWHKKKGQVQVEILARAMHLFKKEMSQRVHNIAPSLKTDPAYNPLPAPTDHVETERWFGKPYQEQYT